MSYSIIKNTPILAKNKTLTTLFILANYGCMYKTDLINKLNNIDQSISNYYFNRIIENLYAKKLIGRSASNNSPRRKIYYITARGWTRLEQCFNRNSENYIRLKTLEKTTRQRTIIKYREDQAIIASISNLFPEDFLPIELPAFPNRDGLDSNSSGNFVSYSTFDELNGKTFFVPWYLLRTDNSISIRNNTITTYWIIKDGKAACYLFFLLNRDPNHNIFTDLTLRQIEERYLSICQHYGLAPMPLSIAITFDIVNYQDYVNATKDVLLGEHQDDYYWQRDRYGEMHEFKRKNKAMRCANNNVQFVAPFDSSNELERPGLYSLRKKDFGICRFKLKKLIEMSLGEELDD